MNREAGFTLLEALAAVTIMATILAGLAVVAGQWLPNWRHGFLTLQSADLIGLALDRVAEDVGAAEYAHFDGAQGNPWFHGGPHQVAFIRTAAEPGAAPRLEAVRLGEVETLQGVEIARSRAKFTPGAVGAFRDAATLLRPPFRLTFAYAGLDGQWQSSWENEPKLPRAVRLSVARRGRVIATSAFLVRVTAAPEIPQPTPDAPDNARAR